MYLTSITLKVIFQTKLGFVKSNARMPLLNILLNIYSTATIKVNELILIRFSPFDIKCKKINTKNLRKCIFRAFGRVSLSYFHTLGHVWVPPDTP